MKLKTRIGASRQPTVASEYRFGNSSERFVGANGELNASSKRDLINQQLKLMTAASNGEGIITEQQATSREQHAKTSKDLITAAFADPQAHRVLGERIAESLYDTANRQGFARKYLAKVPTQQGSIVRFPVRTKNVTAIWSTSPTQIQSQIVRDKWFTPAELQIVARPFVTQNDINQSPGDVLQEKFIEATEAVMVAEDRFHYNLMNNAVGIENNLTTISGQLTPYTLIQVQVNVTQWGMKTPHILMASDLYQDIIGNSDFFQAIDPVARHELLLTGELGIMYGMTITSDAYRFPEHKVLNQGEFFVISDSLNHGAYCDRDGLHSQPTDISIERIPGRGWVLHEAWASAVANARSFAKGVRL